MVSSILMADRSPRLLGPFPARLQYKLVLASQNVHVLEHVLKPGVPLPAACLRKSTHADFWGNHLSLGDILENYLSENIDHKH